jgi:hypothetical protein
VTCPECGIRWLDDRTACDHTIYQNEQHLAVQPALEPEDEAPLGFVPSLADFENMASTMDRQAEVRMYVAGEVMRGKRVGAHFVPSDREGLRNALENARDTMNDVRGQD